MRSWIMGAIKIRGNIPLSLRIWTTSFQAMVKILFSVVLMSADPLFEPGYAEGRENNGKSQKDHCLGKERHETNPFEDNAPQD
jgi:hypothetical protein